MTDDALARELARAKALVQKGAKWQTLLPPQWTVQQREDFMQMAGGLLTGADTYVAYKLLERFVTEIERQETRSKTTRPDENVMSSPLASGLLLSLKAECEAQHARAEKAEAELEAERLAHQQTRVLLTALRTGDDDRVRRLRDGLATLEQQWRDRAKAHPIQVYAETYLVCVQELQALLTQSNGAQT